MPPICRLLLFTISALLLAPAPAALARDSKPAPVVTITIDDTVITRLESMIRSRDDAASDIDAWIDLPGNKELLKVGAAESVLTRAQLYDGVKAVIDGTATEQAQPRYGFGRMLMSPLADYTAMSAELHTRASEWLTRCAQRDALYSPRGVNVAQTVYLHLGGDWDAINKDGAIYINMAFFHDYFAPSWFGLDLLIAHETFHAVQNQAFGNPESAAGPDLAFYSALSKIQREGTARWVEVETDAQGYSSGTYGFYFRAVDQESLRQSAMTLPLLSSLASACYPAYDAGAYAQQVGAGLNSGGPYYTLGEGIAAGIERFAGRRRLIETVENGPLDFFDCYNGLARRHRELAPLPTEALARIEALRKQYGKTKPAAPNQPAAPAR